MAKIPKITIPTDSAAAPAIETSNAGPGSKVLPNREEKKPRVFFAVDIETSGPNLLKHGIIAIGWCVGDEQGHVLEKKRVALKMDGRTFCPDTKSQYWDNPAQTAQLEVFTREAIGAKEAIALFIAAVDRFEDDYRVSIVSDNPAYDVKWLDYYLALHLDRYPLAYTKEKKYRGISEDRSLFLRKQMANPGKWVFDVDKYAFGKELIATTVPHNHWPENDAEFIFHHALLHARCAFHLGTSH